MVKLETLLASALLIGGCTSEPTAEADFYKRIGQYNEHREMRTAGGHELVWSLPRVETIFRRIRAESGWDMNAPHRYGYSFVNNTPTQLRELSCELGHEGYRLVRLELVPDDGQWWLEMEREELHSPRTLHERNVYFSKLAEARHVLYYGWDVERVHQK